MVVVLALCALALLFRLMPYGFLRGAQVKTLQIETIRRPGSADQLVLTNYLVKGTPDEVVGRARRELTAETNWTWSDDTEGIFTASNGADHTGLSILSGQRQLNHGPATSVFILRPATLLDRVLEWIHNR